MLSLAQYPIKNPHQLQTPRLLVFRDKLETNIQRMKGYLNSFTPTRGLGMLCPHVKTHKSSWVTKKLMQAGVEHFKASPNEVEMLVAANPNHIFVAYPLVPSTALWLSQIIKENSGIDFTVQIGHQQHAEIMREVASKTGIVWKYFIDINLGMHRTGVQPQKAFDLYRQISDRKELQLVGLHGYDGHNHSADAETRREIAQQSMQLVTDCVSQFRENGVWVPKIIVGGTPAYRADLETLLSDANLDCEIHLSPGTWVFWDSGYESLMPNEFEFAALILAQVMDLPTPKTATLNLGYKRWAVDQGPVEIFGVDGMKALNWSEEHTVVSVPPDSQLAIGDHVLIAPRHVCSTVNLWESFTVVGPEGNVEIENCPVDARNR